MRIDLNVRQLDAFVRVAECGSFRQAAQQLGQSQPALSGAIRRAEQTLGARLFDRDTRHVRITAVGQELLPIARRILRDFDDALGDLGVVHHAPSLGSGLSSPVLSSASSSLSPS